MSIFSKSACAITLSAALVACQSGPEGGASNIMLEGTPLDRHEIGVRQATEVLEIQLDPAYPTLKRSDLMNLERFVAGYRDRGHGPLIMAMPENGPDQQLAVEAVKVARELAWEKGVAWEAIQGSAYDARGRRAPIVLAFDVYEAVAPDCQSLANYDLADISGNNSLGYLGCSVRFNLAAMLADPADLLGNRELGPRDQGRVSVIMEAYRKGEVTGAAGGDEQVTVSDIGG